MYIGSYAYNYYRKTQRLAASCKYFRWRKKVKKIDFGHIIKKKKKSDVMIKSFKIYIIYFNSCVQIKKLK